MLNGRLYRAALLPFLVALAVAAFSLTARPLPLTSTLAPDAFDGARALASLKSLATEFPDRSPGSAGDDALAERVAHTLEGLGGAAGGGFHVRMRHFGAQTIDGKRTLTTVIAQRAGASGGTPIVILAHRDANRTPGSEAELSGTAALLELARVFAARETERTIVLVSTAEVAAAMGGPRISSPMSRAGGLRLTRQSCWAMWQACTRVSRSCCPTLTVLAVHPSCSSAR